METPSEWAKRFNQRKAEQETGLSKAESSSGDTPAAVAEFPSEPFPCPACGQLLAPSCRVCVACRRTIDPAEIARPREVALPVATAPGAMPKPTPVSYPWRIFFAVLGISFFLAILAEGLVGEQKAQLVMGGIQTLAGVWVFFDALRQRVPRPLRWAVGSMMLPVVIFPWYLARRDKPKSSVAFVEAEVGPVTRFVLFALLVFILASLIFYLVEGPPSTTRPAPSPKIQAPRGNSSSRITKLRRWEEGGRGRGPDNERRLPAGTAGSQAETSAPSDAWQT